MPEDQVRALQIFCTRTGCDFALLSERRSARLYQIQGTDERFDGTLQALRLLSIGRFGNRVWQVLNMMLIARHLGVREISFDVVSAMGDFPENIEGVAIARTPGTRYDVPTLGGIFFNISAFETLLKPYDAVFAEETLRLFVAPFFRHFQPGASAQAPGDIGPDVLVMQFRGGDAFNPLRTDTPRQYVMPPAAYYLQAVSFATTHLGVRRIHLVYEDRSNPALAAVEDTLKTRGIEVTTQSRTLEEDVATLLSATHLVAPYGTFCEGVAMLSTRLRSLFGFRLIESHMFAQRRPYSLLEAVLQARGVRLFVGTDVVPGYIPPLGWDTSAAKVALVLSYPEHGVEFAEAAPFVPPPLDPRDMVLAAARAEARWLRANPPAAAPSSLV